MLYVNIQLNFYETICDKCRCDVASDVLLIKLLRFLNKPSESLQKNGLQVQLIRYDTSVDTDASNQSLTFSVNGP